MFDALGAVISSSNDSALVNDGLTSRFPSSFRVSIVIDLSVSFASMTLLLLKLMSFSPLVSILSHFHRQTQSDCPSLQALFCEAFSLSIQESQRNFYQPPSLSELSDASCRSRGESSSPPSSLLLLSFLLSESDSGS